ncbi:MAG TPA: Hsp20/alpha crystallin family protein [Rhodopila sp.]|uniref:Hsp20/alpha crystallin family protein n=1 Tax=Rhodopila sp. TaxID=2480087 RepID=UPI002CCBF3B5|nr:Hsp20/alpha crystallin family protein [Rhodopila sp.]HVY15356.1 Hsp20/alpha crystallin family protein [Rhodopila sp.]
MANEPVEVKKAPSTPATPDAWRALRSEMERLFDRFAGGFGAPSFGRVFEMFPSFATATSLPVPAVDITEDDAAYKITAELPGLTEKDVEVSLSDDGLTIKGEKSAESEKKEKNCYLSERSYGAFERSFTLPSGVQADKIAASVTNGVLTVTIPKGAAATKKTIEVKAAA